MTSVLYAVYPDRGYFELSPMGRVHVDADGATRFERRASGRHRHLVLQAEAADRVREALVWLVSQPTSP